MPDSTVKVLRRISDLDPESWDACATGSGAYNPFTSYAFLSALEDSNSWTKGCWPALDVQRPDPKLENTHLDACGHSGSEVVAALKVLGCWGASANYRLLYRNQRVAIGE